MLVAADGEWTRRRAGGERGARRLSRPTQIPVYDVQKVGYPQRMRDHDARQRIRAPARHAPGTRRGLSSPDRARSSRSRDVLEHREHGAGRHPGTALAGVAPRAAGVVGRSRRRRCAPTARRRRRTRAGRRRPPACPRTAEPLTLARSATVDLRSSLSSSGSGIGQAFSPTSCEMRGDAVAELVAAHHAGGARAERDRLRAGQRRRLDQVVGLVLAGPHDRVGQDQPALGVGVEHLDGDAAVLGQHVAGTLRGRRRHVLGHRHGRDRRRSAAAAWRPAPRSRSPRRRRPCRRSCGACWRPA